MVKATTELNERTLADWWEQAEPYRSYLGRVEKNHDLWHAVDARVQLPDDPARIGGSDAVRALPRDLRGLVR